MIESLCINLHCLSVALLCYTGFQNQSLIRSTSCSCSTCCFGLGFQLQNLQDFIKISRAKIKDISLICPASSSTATPAREPEEEGEFRRKINEYILHDEYYKCVTGEDGEEPLDALGSPPYTDMGSYPYSGPLRTWPTQCLYPGDLEGQYGVQSCQSLAGALKCAPHM